MPGLLRGMARTAVVVGVAGNVQRRQQQRWAAEDQEQAPQVESQDDQFVQLEKLGQLKDKGILTQEEFDIQKKQILGL